MVPKDDEFLSGCSLDAITVVNLYNILESTRKHLQGGRQNDVSKKDMQTGFGPA